ncbi:MAG: helix-turn-helix domain-containing protein [Planctomycetaceae bacterium]|nr:helix-turn-helix domain-containing protein [Planctomycetaceae bacterium]
MTTTQTESMLIDAKEAAALCGLSRSAWYKQVASGKIPRPLKIGNIARWRRDELEEWIASGCPPRQKWDLLRKRK